MLCRMTFHMDRNGNEHPCCNHGPDCKDRPCKCAGKVKCQVCGMCLDHCIGHTPIREHLKLANGVPPTRFY